jgi:hypothetical protein
VATSPTVVVVIVRCSLTSNIKIEQMQLKEDIISNSSIAFHGNVHKKKQNCKLIPSNTPMDPINPLGLKSKP